jgi:hypothetical protein
MSREGEDGRLPQGSLTNMAGTRDCQAMRR